MESYARMDRIMSGLEATGYNGERGCGAESLSVDGACQDRTAVAVTEVS